MHPMQLGNSEQSVHSVHSQVKSEQSPHSTDTKSEQSPQEMPSGSQPDPKSSQLNPQLKSHCARGEPLLAAANTVIIRSLILNAMRQPPGKGVLSLVGVGVLIYHAERVISKKKEVEIATMVWPRVSAESPDRKWVEAPNGAGVTRSVTERQSARPAL